MNDATHIPGYELLRPLGRGLTSQVYLARDGGGREVALKIPLPETLADTEAAQRFGNEVRLCLQLKHPHLIGAYGGTAFGPQAFLALQYYPYGDLSEQMEQSGEKLSRQEALRILADIAGALDYLHGAGAVHQDVKPPNVYVNEQGRAALGDLGSAYFVAQGSKTSGSPFYMAPEVYRGDPTSPASDVYSLGVMMYELLGGQRPFKGESYDELMMAHLNSFAPSLAAQAPNVPKSVTRLAEKALAKRAEERPSAAQIEQAILEALGEKTKAAPEPEAPAPAAPAGRHGPAADRPALGRTPAATAPASGAKTSTTKVSGKEEEKGGFGWNPFKRKK